VPEIPVEKTVINKEFFYLRDAFWKNVDMTKEAHKQHVIALYDGAVYYSDYIFGKVMDLLKEEDIYDNSMVILLSDHGEEFFEHGDTLHWRLFIESLHVPFMIKFPASEYGGTRIKQKIRTIDLLPSLLQYLGIKDVNVMQRTTFLPLLNKRGEYDPLIKSFSGDLRYIRFVENEFIYSNQPSHGFSEWLFNQSNDPKELENLANVDEQWLTHMKFESRKLMRKEVTIKKQVAALGKNPGKGQFKTHGTAKSSWIYKVDPLVESSA
jgi:arylsulfatase A-like enzyme